MEERSGGHWPSAARPAAAARAETFEERLEREASLALLDAVFTQTPVGLGFLDQDLRFVRINDTLARLHGLSPEEHIGRPVDEVLVGVPNAIASFRHVAETGQPLHGREITAVLPGCDDAGHYFASYFPVRAASGEVLGVGVAVLDITERHRAEEERRLLLESERQARSQAEEAQRRLTFLAEASQMLAESLDVDETMRRVAVLSAAHLADWVLIDVVEGRDIHRMVCQHRDPALQPLVEQMAEGPRDPSSDHPVAQVLITGRSVMLGEVTPSDIEHWARDADQAAVMARLGVSSVMVVPLEARGHTIGALVLVRSDPAHPFEEPDLLFATDLARRAALAADNARLYRDRTRVARTLQRSLLPPALPEIPAMELYASFHAAAEDVEVGGDFYDVFQVGDDEWAVLIGDVCGTGPEAATVTALARHTLRAAAMRARRPARVLAVLNEVLQRQRAEGDDRFCTVAYGRLRPGVDGARLTVACGGHPMPLLVSRVGRIVEVARPGTMLGIIDDPQVVETTTDLVRGDAVVFFTDGVIEARGAAGLYGEARLRSLLGGCAGLTAKAIGERVVASVIEHQEGDLRDDVAVLVVRVTA
ncbi:MAG TPA: SpoIIE family protein phosphatase [Acidimicrobiales bacterium]|nr:SpoIIE family protein phosphatase [Acidimicrobiales bacterium]